ncbi:MAG: signal transduction histidine kinase [Crocinitomicaceae bacterium]|jgi:signal transduction histidine kinase
MLDAVEVIMKDRLFLGVILLAMTLLSHGDLRVSLEDQNRYILSQGMLYFEDSSNTHTINDILKYERNRWSLSSNSSSRSSFGYSNSTYWVHIPFAVEHSALWYVWLRYAPLDYVTFYWLKNGHVIDTYESGDAIPFSARQVHMPENVSHRFLEKGEEIDLYIKIKTQGSYRIPLEIHQSQSFESSTAELLTFQGIYYGVLAVMSVFNLVLFFITGIRSYFYYVFYVLASLFSRVSVDGTGFQFLWGNLPILNQWSIPVSFWLSSIAFLIFSYTFLNVNKASIRVRFYFLSLAFLGGVVGLCMPILSYQVFVPLVSLYATLVLFSMLTSSIVLTLSGYRYAGVFAIATMMSAIAFGLSTFESLGYYSDQTLMTYSYPIARIFEVLLFAVALGVRIRFLQERKNIAEKESILHRENSIKSIEQYKRLYESAMTGNFVLDEKGNIKSANSSFYELLGGKKSPNIQFYFERDISIVFKYGLTQEKFKITKEIKGNNGKWFSANIYKVNIDSETRYEGALVDISDRVEAQEVKYIAEKSKIQALQQLVVGVSHEINTPLGVMRTSSDFARELFSQLQNAVENNELTKSYLLEKLSASDEALKISERSLLRMINIIKSFKRVSIEQMSFDIEPLNLELIEEKLKYNSSIISMPINIKIKDESTRVINTFLEGILWVLDELLDNSFQYGENDMGVFIDFELSDKALFIHFYDKGIGVSDKDLPLILNPFFTTGRGTDQKLGLGLYQVQNIIVQLLHGTVHAYNNNGLNFDIIIPASLGQHS